MIIRKRFIRLDPDTSHIFQATVFTFIALSAIVLTNLNGNSFGRRVKEKSSIFTILLGVNI